MFVKKVIIPSVAITLLSGSFFSNVYAASSLPKVKNHLPLEQDFQDEQDSGKILFKAVLEDDVALGSKLLEEVEAGRINEGGVGLIHLAASLGSLKFIYLLTDSGVQIDQRDAKNRTPLMHAVENNRVDAVAILLDLGADIDLVDDNKESALWRAVKQENEDLVKILVDRGANVNTENKEGISVVYYAKRKRLSAISDVLKNSGVASDVRQNRRTPVENVKVLGFSEASQVAKYEDAPLPKYNNLAEGVNEVGPLGVTGVSSGNDGVKSLSYAAASLKEPLKEPFASSTISQEYPLPVNASFVDANYKEQKLQRYEGPSEDGVFSYANVKFEPSTASKKNKDSSSLRVSFEEKPKRKVELAIGEQISSKKASPIVENKMAKQKEDRDLTRLLDKKLEEKKQQVAFEIEKIEKKKERLSAELEIAKDKREKIYSKLSQVEYKLKDIANTKLKKILSDKVAEAQNTAKKTIEDAENISNKIKSDLTADIESAKNELVAIKEAKQKAYEELASIEKQKENLITTFSEIESKKEVLQKQVSSLEEDLNAAGFAITQRLIDEKLGRNEGQEYNSVVEPVKIQDTDRQKLLNSVIGKKPNFKNQNDSAEPINSASSAPKEVLKEKEFDQKENLTNSSFEQQHFSNTQNIPVTFGNASIEDINKSNYFGINSFLSTNEYDVSLDIIDGTLANAEKTKIEEKVGSEIKEEEGYYFPKN
jgi:hypothetical protein